MKQFNFWWWLKTFSKFNKKLPIAKSDVSDLMVIAEYTPSEILKLFSFRSSKPEIFALKSENELLDFWIEDFVISGKKKNKIVLSFRPKVIGTFRVLSVFLRVFNIPRFLNFDNEFNSMKHFLAYLYGIEPSTKNLSLIFSSSSDSKFINKKKELSSINCEFKRFLCAQFGWEFKNRRYFPS